MNTIFPDIPLYRGWGAPLRLESDIRDVRLLHGEVPKDLKGMLYRCGPAHASSVSPLLRLMLWRMSAVLSTSLLICRSRSWDRWPAA